MTDALFSALEITTDDDALPGYRLHRVEVFNWGTFDRHIWHLDLDGRTSLLTGDIGSGKSTLVDAISTLLLPAHRIAYNKAAGAGSRERTLRSYVEGHFKSERNEQTGASRPVGLRGHSSYSVILGVFRNGAFNEEVTLAQVFRQVDRTGQPERFFVTAPRTLTVADDFSDFGADLTALRRRLRASGADIDAGFPEYSRKMRRLLGIRSEQAMELFHQTVSMKSVGNLTDFVRSHMLEGEEEEAAKRVRDIVDHFENLTLAHEAVQRATAQLAILVPLVEAGDRYDDAVQRRDELAEARAAIHPYVAEQMLTVLAEERSRVTTEHEAAIAERESLKTASKSIVPRRDALIAERAGAGGDRLAEIDRETARQQQAHDERAERRSRYDLRLNEAGLETVADAQAFYERVAEIAAAIERNGQSAESIEERQLPLSRRRFALEADRDRVETEIAERENRRSNVDPRLDAVRTKLCDALGYPADRVPFAGELIDLAPGHEEWREAAERVLGGLATMMLVSDEDYAEVSRWVNGTHLGWVLRFLRVPARQVRIVPTVGGAPRLRDILALEPGPFESFLRGELQRRAEHLLVDSVEALNRADRAVTKQGLVRNGDRHEKDDRRLGPKNWVLGRSSERQLQAFREELDAIVSEHREVLGQLTALQGEKNQLVAAREALQHLTEITSWEEVDTDSVKRLIANLSAERERLLAGSQRLAQIEAELVRIGADDERIASDLAVIHERIGSLSSTLARIDSSLEQEETLISGLDQGALEQVRQHYSVLEDILNGKRPRRSIEGLTLLRTTLADEIDSRSTAVNREINGHTTSVQAKMNDMLREWPELKAEHDPSVAALGAFRELHRRVLLDDLPRFQQEFKTQLDKNTVKDLAGLRTWLRRQRDETHSRVDRINEALAAIDYRPGRVIRIIAEPTINQEVRDFQADLRTATSDLMDSAGFGAEQRFAEVKRIIERFRGRPDHADRDRRWTQFVTDVRNWFVFAASEQDRVTGEEFEHYTDSDGKSGGQKEKLAYTVLAASLAYQFGLEWGAQKTRDFRFAVIDEAFGRGSDDSTRYALELFRKLGLQLLIVTPLQKVHVIEPFISAIGFVDNPTGAYSRLHTLSIEDFHERRKASR